METGVKNRGQKKPKPLEITAFQGDTSFLVHNYGGEGGIRTHVRLPVNAFRVRRVPTTSLLLRV